METIKKTQEDILNFSILDSEDLSVCQCQCGFIFAHFLLYNHHIRDEAVASSTLRHGLELSSIPLNTCPKCLFAFPPHLGSCTHCEKSTLNLNRDRLKTLVQTKGWYPLLEKERDWPGEMEPGSKVENKSIEYFSIENETEFKKEEIQKHKALKMVKASIPSAYLFPLIPWWFDDFLNIFDPTSVTLNDGLIDWLMTSSEKEWMKRIDSQTPLHKISIPGTHDSAANDSLSFISMPYVKTQVYSISNQLTLGVRYFDIRVKAFEDDWRLFHGIIPLITSFSEVLSSFKNFLSSNPSEVIIMKLQNERYEGKDFPSAEIFAKYQKAYPNLFYLEEKFPLLGKVRGKVVLFDRDLGLEDVKLCLSQVKMCDDYQINNEDDLVSKTNSIIQHIESFRKTTKDENYYYWTFFSGSITKFDSINKLYYMPQGIAKKMNTVGLNMAKEGTMGVAIFDFPSAKLIKAVIESNFFPKTRKCTIVNKKYGTHLYIADYVGNEKIEKNTKLTLLWEQEKESFAEAVWNIELLSGSVFNDLFIHNNSKAGFALQSSQEIFVDTNSEKKRKVLSVKLDGNINDCFRWEFIPVKNNKFTFKIRNHETNEFLYASGLMLVEKSRRWVFTWPRQEELGDEGLWIIQDSE